ncbi:MAG TPA: hypothetical protein VMY76_00700 [Gemmatimonadales bacterium]|nr:hypothetical protein [Gemmatimonadales bacterium]
MADVPDGDREKMTNIGLHLPEWLSERLAEIAKAKRYRGRNSLIVAVLRGFVGDYDKELKGGKR